MSKEKENGAARYYSRIGSWAGYNLVLGRSQHAGYWREETKNEREAQQNFLEEFAKLLNLRPGERVLDAGSGRGVMARYLAEKTGVEVIGITVTPREITVSNKLSRGMKNAPKFILGDYMNTDFADDYFDVVYVNETLSHARNIAELMKEFYRILKPGGRVVFADYEIDMRSAPDKYMRLAKDLERYAGGYGVMQQNPGWISQALRDAKFEDVSETDWTDYVMPTFHRLRRLA
ncbi:MAG: methyltransferase domain-containing protein [Candidatus Saccharibacteria bacterium]|nr:methyltransferase domain-containing protein [Candidatus Saccharibacteria bacterium]